MIRCFPHQKSETPGSFKKHSPELAVERKRREDAVPSHRETYHSSRFPASFFRFLYSSKVRVSLLQGSSVLLWKRGSSRSG
jgi:hypothetical protein